MRAKPAWVPDYVPSLDGLRGLAIALVVVFHCKQEFTAFHLEWVAKWGWTGVNLFFVLSGFLITGIILDGRRDPHFFRNFYARRALRIWPIYFALLPITYFIFHASNMWNRPEPWWTLSAGGVPWLFFVLFIQNLFHGLAGTIYPTWSLAIEEQFYLVWAPLGRLLATPALLALLLAAYATPAISRTWLDTSKLPPLTIFKLDGLAVGGLIALGLRTTSWSRAVWRALAWAGVAGGLWACAYAWLHGGPYYDTFLALGYGGLLLHAILSEATGGWYRAVMTFKPLVYLGTISYGLYLLHMPVFALLGGVDVRMEKRGAWGALAIVAARLSLSVIMASLSWFFFEKRILRLKRFFRAKAKPAPAARAMAERA